MSNEPIENQWLKILEKYYDTAFIEIETMKIKYVHTKLEDYAAHLKKTTGAELTQAQTNELNNDLMICKHSYEKAQDWLKQKKDVIIGNLKK